MRAVILTKVISKMEDLMALGFIKLLKVLSIKDSGLMVCMKEKGRRRGPMALCTSAASTLDNFMAMEFKLKLMKALIKANGFRIKSQEREYINGLMVALTKVPGLITKCMAREKWYGLMAKYTMALL